MKRTVCKETLDFLRWQIDWNKEDQGERGEYIKTKYVYNLIDDMEKAMSSNRVRMNWPFAEESVQDGANREMDEEDTKSECDSPDSPTVTDLKAACSGGYRVKIDFIGCQRTGVVTSTARGTFKFMEDGDGCEHSHHFAPVRSVERVDSDVAKERWRVTNRFVDSVGKPRGTVVREAGGVVVAESLFADNIAAASEMLNVLETLDEGISKYGVFNQDGKMTLFLDREYVESVKAVIKKARGGGVRIH